MRWKGDKGKAWKAFADYIKLRDCYTCITCGLFAEGSGMHAGHFIPIGLSGSNGALAWDERNVHAQCMKCNVRWSGWGERYAEVLEARYGKMWLDFLREERHRAGPKHPPWKHLVVYYVRRLECLQIEREKDLFFDPGFTPSWPI